MCTPINRRVVSILFAVTGAIVVAAVAARAQSRPLAESLPEKRTIAPGPFQPTWESLVAGYKCPEWFRDAKFGIWAHWSAQCVPEQGDWYARTIYVPGTRQHAHHIATYGHPSEFGFLEIDNLWKAERWNPEELMRLYVDAGARFFVAMANHEDNFDAYDSRYHEWNSVNVGPRRDIIGTWARVARAHGLRFGVSNHSSHAWHWFQPAYGYDGEGPYAGVRYDAARLTRADGRGKWWEGLDPQELYCGPMIVLPDGLTSNTAVRAWHDANNLPWTEEAPPMNPRFVDKWFFRLQDLVDKYQPDYLYLDNTELPLGQAGLDAAAHFYNSSMTHRGGVPDGVLTAKGMRAERRPAVVQDYERSAPPGGIQSLPFETGTCIGQWHYKRDIEYKSVAQVVRILVDVVSKNGTLLLSIPQRGDGTIDEHEVAFLRGMGAWMKVNGQAIYDTRPWKVFGEGPTQVPRGRAGDQPLPYTQEDIRFTTKNGRLFVFVIAPPSASITIESLGAASEHASPIARIALLGSDKRVTWEQRADALVIEKPVALPSADVFAYEITFR